MSDDDENLAAEYALGVLDEPTRREVERRMAADTAFAAEVAAWEARLAPIAAEAPEAAPPRRVWRAIEDRLDARGRTRSVRFWRNFGLGWMTLALASFAALVFVVDSPPRPMFATLQQQGGAAAFVVGVDIARDTVYVVPAAFSRDVQRVAELWLLPPGGRPRSLGLLDPTQPMRISIPPELRAEVTGDAALAVSLEPPGGSPTGLPTGPVIAQGKISAL
jgi:anti-sigma-K factor RskA